MPKALYFTDDPEACKLLAEDPFALLVGFAIDQQVPVPKAFAGPYVLQQRVGTLDRASWRVRPEEAFRTVPAIHRFPVPWPNGSANSRRSWSRLRRRRLADLERGRRHGRLEKPIGALPGFGKMKVTALGSVLAKQFGVKLAEPLVPAHACLGEVDSPEALQRYQAAKREHKAKLRAEKA